MSAQERCVYSKLSGTGKGIAVRFSIVSDMSVTLHTSKGDIKLELACELVPRSSANFLALCGSGKYDATKFHRIVRSFIIQGGDPTGKGTVSRAAFARRMPDEPHESLTFEKRGIVAFANTGKVSQTGVGSQFFITVNPARHLDGTCTVIGRVIHGMDVVEAIASVPIDDKGRPVDTVSVDNVTIHANPFATGELEFNLGGGDK